MSEFTRSLAVVIGINDYGNGIDPLKTAVNDAEAIAQLLEDQHEYEICPLFDQEATLLRLKSLLEEELPQKLGSNDRLLFYFAGHGITLEEKDGPVGYLVPQDARREDSKSFLPMLKLHDALLELPCRHVLIVLDCCFSGAFRWSTLRKLTALPEKMYRERYERYIQDPAWQIITSSAYDQTALDMLSSRQREVANSGEHSPFAEALLEGLRGDADLSPKPKHGQPMGDGVITATELYQYLRDWVEAETEENHHRQTPGLWQLRNHDKGEFIFLVPGHELSLPSAPPLDEDSNPYRGLESFEPEHSDLFFGREKLTAQLQKVVESNPLTVVVGASGVGKSSLVKAGLIPRLKKAKAQQWHVLDVVRPGDSPLKELARVILSLDGTHLNNGARLEETSNTLAQHPEKLIEILQAWRARNPQKQLLLVIDQFEELITLNRQEHSPDDAETKRQKTKKFWQFWRKVAAPETQETKEQKASEQTQFMQLLRYALSKDQQFGHIVVTLRSDFEPLFLDSPLKRYWSQFSVTPMSRDELRQVIEKPAENRVMYFKPHSLVEQLVNEVWRTPGALPLLSFTLSELYRKSFGENRFRGDRSILEDDYVALGRVMGALTQRATQEYERLVQADPAFAQTVKMVMLRMVASEGGETARRRVASSELVYADAEENQRVQTVIKRFTQERLLVEGTSSDGEPYVEPAHDALILGWALLQKWKNAPAEQENIALQNALRPAVEAWQESQADSDLWDKNSRLDQLVEIYRSGRGWLNKTEAEFVEDSRKRRRKGAYRLAVTVAGVVVVLSGIATVAVLNANEANRNLQEAQRRNVETLNQTSKVLLRDGQGFEALLTTIESGQALHQLEHDEKQPLLGPILDNFHDAFHQKSLLQDYYTLDDHTKDIETLAFSPSGEILATGSDDSSVKLWRVSDGSLITTLDDHTDTIWTLAFSPSGETLATGSEDNSVKLWRVSDGSLITTLDDHTQTIETLAFSPSGETLATGSVDNSVKLWRVSDGSLITTLDDHTSLITTLAFSPSGEILATGSVDSNVKLWRVSDGSLITSLDDHTEAIYTLAFSPSGETLATGGSDSTVKLWRVSDGSLITSLDDHTDDIWTLAFSPSGETLATGSEDSSVKLWRVRDGSLITSLNDHTDTIWTLAFSPSGETLATGSEDGSVRLWRIIDGSLITSLDDHTEAIYTLAFSPSGETLATGSGDSSVRLWRIIDGSLITSLDDHTQTIEPFMFPTVFHTLAFRPSGETLATGSN